MSRSCRAAPAAGLLGALALVATGGCWPAGMTGAGPPSSTGTPVASSPSYSPAPSSPSPSLAPSPPPSRILTRAAPRSGPGTFRYVSTAGAVLGRAGPIRRFRLGLESNLTMLDPAQVAAQVDRVLGDPRSWIGGGAVRFQRVPPGAPYDFTVNLATASTTTAMCDAGGVPGTNEYTSCRIGGHVVLNADRWLTSVPYYTRAGQPLDTYRAYMINHEVGHQLGYGHERCPGSGRPAPVMEQQTLGLHGCTPNPWPYLNGSRYTGPPGSY